MVELSLMLVLAHLIGDFLFQPAAWVKDKRKYKIRSKYLYLHLLVHFALLLLITKFNFDYLFALIVIVVSHFAIDCAKLYFEKKKTVKSWFFIDQILHLSVIAAIVRFYYPYEIDFEVVSSSKSLALLTTLITVTYVSAIVLKILLSKWSDQINNDDTNNAGKYIGILERLFIFFFVLINFWEGIGFLLAAKSIFRFGDLKESKDVKLTEYILIGTLLSFGLGILCAIVYKYFAEIL
jgi:hypothetical protein